MRDNWNTSVFQSMSRVLSYLGLTELHQEESFIAEPLDRNDWPTGKEEFITWVIHRRG
jgi:hypothetical protein